MSKLNRIDGLPEKNLHELEDLHRVEFDAIDTALIKKLFRQRLPSGHKGTFGHTLVIAGSEGTCGAAILTSMAALRSGCGLLTASIPASCVSALLSVLPEAMTRIRTGSQDIRDLDLTSYDAIAFGPGVGISQDSTDKLLYLLENYKGPLVIDADGLNILSRNQDMYELLNENVILTPHPIEFGRLSVTDSTRKDIVHAQINFHKQYRAVLLVKGKNTTVVNGTGVYYNTTGNAGMATAGSGDVLTGIISSLCAQDYTPADAALIGTFLHGYAGDIAAGQTSEHSLIATDIIQYLHTFFRKFETID